MKLTTTIPTETGWYWFFGTREEWRAGYRTGRHLYDPPALVRVEMEYKFRNKVVPHVIGINWRESLANMGKGRPSYWSAKLAEPEIPAPEYPKEGTP